MQQKQLLRNSKLIDPKQRKIKCNRGELWTQFNSLWPKAGKEIQFNQKSKPSSPQKTLKIDFKHLKENLEIIKRIEQKQRLLESVYMPKKKRNLTQPSQVQPSERKRTITQVSKRVETPSPRRSITTQPNLTQQAPKRKKRLINPQHPPPVPIGLSVERCRLTSRETKVRIDINYNVPYRPISEKLPTRVKRNKNPIQFRMMNSVPLTRWDYSDPSIDLQ